MERIKKFEPLWGVWKCEAVLGEGGFGRVYMASRKDGNHVYQSAIKHISVPASEQQLNDIRTSGFYKSEKDVSEYFDAIVHDVQSEIDLMYALKANANIVSYEDHLIIPKEDGIGCDIFIRMELLTSLNNMLSDELTQSEVVKIGTDICSALEICSKAKVIHRDIKPSNIFVNANGDYKLGDFGIARVLGGATTGVSKKGTYSYMAPEIYKCEPANFTSDIFSLGIVLYRMLNDNRLPFMPLTGNLLPQHHEAALIKMVSGAPMPPPKNATPQLAQVILKACAYNKRDRFQSAAEFKKALNDALNGCYNNSKAVTHGSRHYDYTVADITQVTVTESAEKTAPNTISNVRAAAMEAPIGSLANKPQKGLGIFKKVIAAETILAFVLQFFTQIIPSMASNTFFMILTISLPYLALVQYILCISLEEKNKSYRIISAICSSAFLFFYTAIFAVELIISHLIESDEYYHGSKIDQTIDELSFFTSLFSFILSISAILLILVFTLYHIFAKQKKNYGWISLAQIISTVILIVIINSNIHFSIRANVSIRIIYAAFVIIGIQYVLFNRDKTSAKTFERLLVIQIIAIFNVIFACINSGLLLSFLGISLLAAIIFQTVVYFRNKNSAISERFLHKFQIICCIVTVLLIIVVIICSLIPNDYYYYNRKEYFSYNGIDYYTHDDDSALILWDDGDILYSEDGIGYTQID